MLIIYLLIGALSGLFSGLLGIGGGIIVIPALSTVFLHNHDIPSAYITHLAIGTSLGTMIVTSASAFYAHYRRGSVRWDIFWQVIPGLALGAMIGALIAHKLPSVGLRVIFSLFLMMLGMQLLVSKKPQPLSLFSRPVMMGISGLIGVLSSILGAGGGTMLVPFFLRCRLDVREATGTSVGCGMMIGFVASLTFIAAEWFTDTAIAGSTGFIYWPAFVGIAMASMLFAPLGTALAYKLPASLLKRVFAIFLLIIAVDMLLFPR
jgi:uncharacterized membrane protein YfcA